MTTAPVRPIPALGSRLTVPTVPSRRRVPLLGRVVALVTLAEQTLTAMHTAVNRTNALLDRVEAVTCTAEGVVQATRRAMTVAAGVTEETRVLTARAAPLLEGYSEPLHRLKPTVCRWPRPPSQAKSMPW